MVCIISCCIKSDKSINLKFDLLVIINGLFSTFKVFSELKEMREAKTSSKDGIYVVWRDSSISENRDNINISLVKRNQVHHIPIKV